MSEGDQSRDRVWIERVAAGDREAYSALYDRYASVMFGAALRLFERHTRVPYRIEPWYGCTRGFRCSGWCIWCWRDSRHATTPPGGG